MKELKEKFELELKNILHYWSTVAFDEKRKRFYGKVDNGNNIDETAPLGSVLYARIVWSFAAGYRITHNPLHKQMAKYACVFLMDNFVDVDYGGVYWSLDASGKPLETKKQVYALAFAIYGLSEYYKIEQDSNVLELAKQLFYSIEKHSYDKTFGGYQDAFNRDWSSIDDMRLSAKDANEKKTMNTHLHIVEAYANLYEVWKDETLLLRIREILDLFQNKIIDKQTYHLNLFFDEQWQVKSDIISYGHDIEAGWLLLYTSYVLKDSSVTKNMQRLAIQITDAAMEGINIDGSLSYEYHPQTNSIDTDRHWWVQAEALVGLLNTWRLDGSSKYLSSFKACETYIDNHIIDHAKGEWFWGIHENNALMEGQDKVGLWKCPYHNSRSCIEVINMLQRIL